ncbi:mannose-ethanolamine phosphotransferase gpi13 [Dimargaris cristalligena]|nr:mannose-ethanolamine phosphotransferase gpi13 [Dimargaris cristalligena]
MSESSATPPSRETTSPGPRPKRYSPPRTTPSLALQFTIKGLFGVWILALSTIGLYLFAKGFLLTRSTLPDKSTCALNPLAAWEPKATRSEETPCWYPARYRRAVVVVIDAFRFDFAAPVTSDPAAWNALGWGPAPDSRSSVPLSASCFADRPNPNYHGHLPFVQHLLQSQPERTQLFRFLADPPTTTLQRLKGLTTGTLPTFIDMGSNFAGSAIDEDSWIWQFYQRWVRRQPKGGAATAPDILFTGDDTWMALFPTIFESLAARAFPFPSFNVWDLHTLDNGVLDILAQYAQVNTTSLHRFEADPELVSSGPALAKGDDWQLIIAHMLGVDHCGHRFGPDHLTMAQKLDQMNLVLEQIVKALPDDTLLLVMGDHGMDQRGDHGGDNPLELEAALLAYAKGQPLVDGKLFRTSPGAASPSSAWLADVLQDIDQAIDDAATAPFVRDPQGRVYRSITQTDLVPTLSLLLGLPIPFNNLGSIIPEWFYIPDSPSPLNAPSASVSSLLQAMRTNSHQMYRYLDTYAQRTPGAGGFSASLLVTWREQLDRAEAQFAILQAAPEFDAQLAQNAFRDYLLFTRSALATSRRLWAQFNTPLIFAGLLVLALACTMLGFLVVRTHGSDFFGVALNSSEPITLGLLMGGGIAVLALVRWPWTLFVWDQALIATLGPDGFSVVEAFLLGASVGSCIGWSVSWAVTVLSHRSRDITPKERRIVPTANPRTLMDWSVLGGVLLIHALTFASNSFVVFEDRIVAFLLQTTTGYFLWRARALPEAADRFRVYRLGAVFAGLSWIASYSTICREEQGLYCTPTFYASVATTTSSGTSLILLLSLAVIFPAIIIQFVNRTRNNHGITLLWNQFGLRLLLLLSASYWLIDHWQTHSLAPTSGESVPSTGLPNSSSTVAASEITRSLRELFSWPTAKLVLARLVFGLSWVVAPLAWSRHPLAVDLQQTVLPPPPGANSTTERMVRVTLVGRANMFGASYLTMATMIWVPLVLVQLPAGGVTMFALALQILCMVAMTEIVHSRAVPNCYQTSGNEFRSRLPSRAFVTAFRALQLGLLSWHYFFATGHQAVISSIQWPAAFIGLSEMHLVLSGLLVVLNSLGSFIVVALLLPLGALWMYQHQPSTSASATTASVSSSEPPASALVTKRLGVQMGLYILYQAILTLTTAIFAAHFRRHLMVWKIFAPRFMLAAPVLLLSSTLLVFLSGGWIAWKVSRENLALLRFLQGASA